MGRPPVHLCQLGGKLRSGKRPPHTGREGSCIQPRWKSGSLWTFKPNPSPIFSSFLQSTGQLLGAGLLVRSAAAILIQNLSFPGRLLCRLHEDWSGCRTPTDRGLAQNPLSLGTSLGQDPRMSCWGSQIWACDSNPVRYEVFKMTCWVLGHTRSTDRGWPEEDCGRLPGSLNPQARRGKCAAPGGCPAEGKRGQGQPL